jgi:hypothetical protein
MQYKVCYIIHQTPLKINNNRKFSEARLCFTKRLCCVDIRGFKQILWCAARIGVLSDFQFFLNCIDAGKVI